jgi:hypothetical protein
MPEVQFVDTNQMNAAGECDGRPQSRKNDTLYLSAVMYAGAPVLVVKLPRDHPT